MREWFTFDALWAFCELHASRIARTLRAQLGDPLDFMLLVERRPMYYDRQGFPIPSDGERDATLVWAMDFGRDDRTLARDDLPDGSWLSTVWLGIDQAPFGFGPPLIFETMRFAKVEQEMTIPFSSGRQTYHPSCEFPDPETGEMTDQLRYTTEEEALAAHHEIVRRIRVREGH